MHLADNGFPVYNFRAAPQAATDTASAKLPFWRLRRLNLETRFGRDWAMRLSSNCRSTESTSEPLFTYEQTQTEYEFILCDIPTRG